MISVQKHQGKAILKIDSISTVCQFTVTNSSLIIQSVEQNGTVSISFDLKIVFFSKEYAIRWVIENNLTTKCQFLTIEQSLSELKPFLDGYIPYNNFSSLYTVQKKMKQLKGGQIMKVVNILTNQIEVAKQICFGSEYDPVHNKIVYHEITMAQYFTQFPHKNLLKLLAIFLENNSVILVFEYIEITSLYRLVNQFPGGVPFEILRKIMKTTLKALRHMHKHKIMHRDIKMDNILMRDIKDPKSIVIIDYGFATSVKSKHQILTKCGTPGYFAPEVLQDEEYNELCDIYSVAQVFRKLLNGTWEESSIASTRFPVLSDLLLQMNQDKRFRPSAQECLDHDFFVECKIQNLVMRYSDITTVKHPCSN